MPIEFLSMPLNSCLESIYCYELRLWENLMLHVPSIAIIWLEASQRQTAQPWSHMDIVMQETWTISSQQDRQAEKQTCSGILDFRNISEVFFDVVVQNEEDGHLFRQLPLRLRSHCCSRLWRLILPGPRFTCKKRANPYHTIHTIKLCRATRMAYFWPGVASTSNDFVWSATCHNVEWSSCSSTWLSLWQQTMARIIWWVIWFKDCVRSSYVVQ